MYFGAPWPKVSDLFLVFLAELRNSSNFGDIDGLLGMVKLTLVVKSSEHFGCPCELVADGKEGFEFEVYPLPSSCCSCCMGFALNRWMYVDRTRR
eukprot:1490791-Amphidinium_carterae.5